MMKLKNILKKRKIKAKLANEAVGDVLSQVVEVKGVKYLLLMLKELE